MNEKTTNIIQCRLFKYWNADTADINSADFRGLFCNPLLSAFENPRYPRAIYDICITKRRIKIIVKHVENFSGIRRKLFKIFLFISICFSLSFT